MTTTLSAQNLRKSFEHRAVLRDISLQLESGTFTVIAGGNGAGKTTLMKLLAKLMKPDAGSISIMGSDIWRDGDAVRRHVGFLSHSVYLYDDLNALENLRFTARLFGVPDAENRIRDVLRRINLYHRQYDPLKTYSRGMQQRLALARTILHDPDILLLDEPFTGLDEAGVDVLYSLIEEYKHAGKSAILVTHNLQRGYDLADELVILHRGQAWFSAEKSDISYPEYHRKYRAALEEE